MSAAALVADIGGTHARFALVRDGALQQPRVLATADFADLASALQHALETLNAPQLEGVAACAAGPPRDGAIRLTNCPWEVRESALAQAVDGGPVILVNDFTAQAAALGALRASQLRPLGRGTALPGAPRAVIGPGTGLGVSAALPGPAGDTYVTGEGGHVSLAAADAREDQILARLRERFGHVSAERVLSGQGLVNLYCAMHPEQARPAPSRGEEVAALARAGDEPARACLRQFCCWLGAVAGDVALTFGARGGVYLTGGILPAWGTLFDEPAFRRRFEAKGRHAEYLAGIPTSLITAPYPALAGLARLLADRTRIE